MTRIPMLVALAILVAVPSAFARTVRHYAPDPRATFHATFEGTAGSLLSPPIQPMPTSRIEFTGGTQGQGLLIGAGKRLLLPGSIIPGDEGLIQFWCRLEENREAGEGEEKDEPIEILSITRNGHRMELRLRPDLRLEFRIAGTRHASAVTPPIWKIEQRFVHVAVAYRAGSMLSVYVDGAFRGSTACPGLTWPAVAGDDAGTLTFGPGEAMRIDDLLVTPSTDRLLFRVHRDFIRTAPLESLRIDSAPFGLVSEQIVLAGQRKQIGLRGVLPDGQEIALIELGGSRSYHLETWDGRGILELEASPSSIAKTDAHAGVIGLEPGIAEVTARYGELTAQSTFQVVSPRQPDLSVRHIEITPPPDPSPFPLPPSAEGPGEIVLYGHVANHGLTPAPAFRYEWTVFADVAGTGNPDPQAEVLVRDKKAFPKSLAPGEVAIIETRLPDPGRPFFVELRVDPEGMFAELSRTNNFRTVWSQARAVRFAVTPGVREEFEGALTLTGSLGLEDLLAGHIERLNGILAEAMFAPITPTGVHVRLRLDGIEDVPEDTPAFPPHESFDHVKETGRFLLTPTLLRGDDRVRWQYDLLHELCHAYLGLPDTFCYGVRRSSIYVTGPDGVPASSTDRIATIIEGPIDGSEFVYFSSTTGPEGSIGLLLPEIGSAQRGVTCLGPLMSTSFPRLSASMAGHAHHYRTFPRLDADDAFICNVPWHLNRLLVEDVDGDPLPGARVRVFQQTPRGLGCFAGYFPDCPKFVGRTAEDGTWVLPRRTDAAWDDPDTDPVEGAFPLAHPFGTRDRPLPLPPDLESVSTTFLVEISRGSRVSYHFLDIDRFHLAFYAGDRIRGTYTLRTSITREEAASAPHLENVETPSRKRDVNRRPSAELVGAVPETMRVGETLVLDASASRDPDGDPIVGFFWADLSGALAVPRGFGPTFRVDPGEPGPVRIRLTVNDSVRESLPRDIVIDVVP